MEFSINGKQAIAVVWTLVSIVVALIIVLSLGLPYYGGYPYSFIPWAILVALFFGIVLVMVLPVYLFIALWQILSRSNSE